MDKVQLRKKDFITSLILIGFGVWMFLTTTKMPMKDSYGGVMNVWFVSPALFPLFISMAIFVLGIVLSLRAIREGGAKTFFDDLSTVKLGISDKSFRFLSIVIILCAYVYVNIPRIDFFLSTMLCLVIFISIFYLDRTDLLKKLISFYFVGSLLILLVFVLGIDKPLNRAFLYAMDLLVFLFYLSLIAYCRFLVRGDVHLRKRFKTTLVISVVVPLILCPAFKYFLLVPLPKEGGMIELMNLVRYSLR